MQYHKKLSICILIILFIMNFKMLGDEYRPYPVLCVHGINSDSTTWKEAIEEDYSPNLYHYFNDPLGNYYDEPFLEADYLEVFSFSQEGVGSIDPDPPYCGEGTELKRWIRYVLDKYYGDGDTTDVSEWINDPDAKVIIIAHSAGGLATRQYIKEIRIGPLQHHIIKFISTSAVHNGSDIAYLQWLIGEPLDFVLRFGGYGSSKFVKEYNEIIDMLEALTKIGWMPMTCDLVPSSPLIRDLKGQPVPSGIKFHCLVNRHPWPDWPFYTTITIGGVLITPIPPPYCPWLGYTLIASGTIGEYWNINSDGVVYKTSQNINHIKSTYNAEIIEKTGIGHSGATDQWQVFLNFLEDPPVIHLDSVITVDDEVFPISGTKDTVPGFIKGFWGRVDDYLLASNDLRISCNYFTPRRLHWPDELGYDENQFKVEDIQNQIYFGWNYIEITSKNVLGENAEPKTYELLVLGGPMANIIRPGWNEAINPKGDTLYTAVAASDTIVGLKETLIEVDSPGTDTFNLLYKEEYFDSLESDTIKCPIPEPYDEGKYKLHFQVINAYAEEETSHAFRSFYVDTTPPDIEIILPDTIMNVFSPKVDSSMPIAFKATDNLQEILNSPKDGLANIRIIDSNGVLVKDTTISNIFYATARLMYWNFVNNDGQKVMESGEYKAIVSLKDKAGNRASDTASFYIDTDPPHIEITQPLSPNIFTSNETFIEMRYLTNEWTEMNVTFIDYQDTTQKYARIAYGDSADIDSNGVQDTCYFFEGPGALGEYIPDGRYAVDVVAKDKVGNDTTVANPLGIDKDTLYVDRTKPQIYQVVCVPWVVGQDNMTNLRFILSEEQDAEINRKGLQAIITVDDSVIIDTVTMNAITDTFNVPVNLTGFKDGIHTIAIDATDWCDNNKSGMATAIKGTIGAMFTMPSDGDTIPRGYVTLKGFAADPDMGNHYGFEKYEIYYRTHTEGGRGVPVGWKINGIEVPPGMREPGGPLNRSIIEVTKNSTLAYWDTEVAGTGLFDILLRSTEEVTGDSISDTVTINIGLEDVTNPSISIDEVNPSPFNTDTDSVLTVIYNLTDKAGNVSLDLVNPRDEVVFHQKYYNIIPYEGIPSGRSEFGFYFYKEDTVWYIYWSNPDTALPTSFTGTIEGFGEGILQVVDTTDIGESGNYYLSWNSLEINAICQGGLNGFGFTSTFDRLQLILRINGVEAEEQTFIGASKAQPPSMPFIIEQKKDFFWDGRKQNGAVVGSGLYKIIGTAEGFDGTGKGADSSFISIVSVFKVDSISRDPDFLYPNYGDTLWSGKVTLFYKLNRDAYVSVDIYKGDDSLTTVQDEKFIPGTGNIVHKVSWDGRYGNNVADSGTDYRFKLTAISSDSLDDISAFSETFSVIDSIPVKDGEFFIPDRYYVGGLYGNSVYTGKNEFSWSATAEGQYFPPQDFQYEVKRGGFKNRIVEWEVAACIDSQYTDTLYYDRALPVYMGQIKESWLVPDSVQEGYEIKVKDYNDDWNSFTHNPFYYRYTQFIVSTPDPPAWHSFLIGIDTFDVVHTYDQIMHLGELADSSSYYALDLEVPISQIIVYKTDSVSGIDTSYATKPDILVSSWTFATSQYYRFFSTVDEHTVEHEYRSVQGADTIKWHGVSTIFDLDTSIVKVFVDPDTSYSKWDTAGSFADTCFVDTSSWGYDTVVHFLDSILTVPYDYVCQATVWDSVEKTGGSDLVDVSLDSLDDLKLVKASVSGWNSAWSSAMDPLLSDGILYSDSPSVFIRDYFSISGIGEDNIIFSDYYESGLIKDVYWKVTLSGTEEVFDTITIFHDTSSQVGIVPISTDVKFINKYSRGGIITFSAEKGHSYSQVQKMNQWYIKDKDDNVLVTDSLGTGAYRDIEAWFSNIDTVSRYDQGNFTVTSEDVSTNWDIDPPGDSIVEYKYYTVVERHTEIEVTHLPEPVTISIKGVNITFNPDWQSIHASLFSDEEQITFWSYGDSSNPYLKIEDWDVDIYSLKGDSNIHLTANHDSVYIDSPLIFPHGFGRGAEDYYKPFLLLRKENPKQYLEIDGKSGESYYRFYYCDGENIIPITDSIKEPVPSDSAPLAFWDVASVCGNEQVIMMLYSNPDTTIPDSIKVRNFYIGDLFQPASSRLLAHSPYFRAQLHFDSLSFIHDTLTKISPFSLAEVKDPRVPLIGGNYNPVVMMQPFGAKFQIGERPTLLFKYTRYEVNEFEIDPTDLRIYAISDEGELEYITSYDTLDQDSVLIITASPDNFPGEGKHPYFSTLNITETDTIRPEITRSYLLSDSICFVEGYGAPGVPLKLISTDPMHNIYDVIDKMGGTREGPKGGEVIDTVVVIPGQDGYFKTDELNVASGNNVIFAANNQAIEYAIQGQERGGKEEIIKNCPVGFSELLVDTTLPRLVLEDTVPTIDDYFGADTLNFFLTKKGRILYRRFDLEGICREMSQWDVLAEQPISVVWNGTDSLGSIVPNGHYQYQLVAFDEQGHKADEIWSYWDLRRKLNVCIYLPQNDTWLNKTVNLYADIEEDIDLPINWEIRYSEGKDWENVALQPGVDDTIPWNTVYTEDGRNVLLRAWTEDPVEIRGEDTVIVNIDNTPPVTSLSIGEPQYTPPDLELPYVTSVTPFTLSAYDSLIGVDKTTYAIDDTTQTLIYSDPFTIDEDDGIHYVYYRSEDVLGNLEVLKSRKIFLDNTPPLLTMTFGRPHYIYQNNIYITSSTDVNLNTSDDGCGTSSSIYNIDNGPWVTYEEDTSFRLSTQPDGYHYVHCKNIDNLGNSKAYSIELSVDNTEPESRIIVGEPKYIHPETNRIYLTSHTPISISSQDPEVNQVSSGVDASLYRIDGGQWIKYEGEFTLIGNDGEYQIEYYSRDNVENTEAINKIKLILDNTPPEPPQNFTATIIPGTANVPGISGEITHDTHWSGNVLVSGDVHVREGVTLTIERGTNIRFTALQDDRRSGEDTTRAELIVDGRIVAEGSHQDSIRFTSIVYGQVQLNWLEGPEWDLNEYNLYRRTDTTHFVMIDSVPHPETTYLDTTVFYGDDYYYIARAVDFLGNESSPSNEDSILPRGKEPADWYGIEIDQISSLVKSIFRYCIVEYGRLGILCNPASPEIRNSLFASNYELSTVAGIPSAAIVGLNGSSPDISNNTILLIPRSSFGIWLSNSKMDIVNNTIKSSKARKELEAKRFRDDLFTESADDTSILDTLDAGIRVINCSGKVVRNTLTSTGFAGIIALGGKSITLEGNKIYTDNQMFCGISLREQKRARIERNTIKAVNGIGSSEGIYIEQCDSTNVLNGNEIQDTRITGISYRSSSSILVQNNIVNNHRYGIANVKEGGDLIVSKNLISGNMYGVYIEHTISTPNLGNLHNQSDVDDGGNRIYLNINRDVYNSSSSKVMAHNNCWGSVDSLTIDTLLIYDDDEQPGYGLVDYSYFSSPDIILTIGEPKYSTEPTYITSVSPFSLGVEDTVYCSPIESIEYAIDNSVWMPYMQPFNVEGEGPHIVKYQGFDYIGNVIKYDPVDVAVDETPPKSELNVGIPQYINGSDVFVSSKTPMTIFAEDPLVHGVASGVKVSMYRIDSGNWRKFHQPFYLEGYDGEHFIEYFSLDNLENEEFIRKTRLVLDNTAPKIFMDIGEPQYVGDKTYVSDETDFSMKGTDGNGSGLSILEYRIDLGDWEEYDAPFGIPEEGLHTLEYRGWDNVENVSPQREISVAVDLTPPISEIIPGDPHYVYGDNDSILVSSQTSITIDAHDSLSQNVASGVEMLKYRINQGTWFTVLDSTVVFNLFGEDGKYIVDYKGRDHVKNLEATNSQVFILNNVIPTAEIISPKDSTLVNGTVSIMGTAWHKYFGWYRVEYGKGVEPTQWEIIKPETEQPVIEDLLTEWNTFGIPNGIYTIRLVVSDLLNRISEDRVVIAIGKPEFVFEIPGFRKPEGVEVDRVNNIYVANTLARQLKIYDPFANPIDSITVGEKTNDVAIDYQINIYTTVYNDTVLKYDPQGNLIDKFDGFKHPKGITLDSTSNIYITDTKHNRIVKLNPKGALLMEITDTGLLHPEGMALDDSLNIYFCNTPRSTIRKYSPAGDLLLEFGEYGTQPGQFDFPVAVDVDLNGNIYACDRNNNRIQVFDSWGNPLMQFGTEGSKPGEFNRPEGIALDEQGGIYVADRNNDRIQKFSIPFFGGDRTMEMLTSDDDIKLEITEAVNVPNPFNPVRENTRIRVVLSKYADVSILIYTLTGKLVHKQEFPGMEGINEVVWDGRNYLGELVNNGVYGLVVKAKSGDEQARRFNKIAVVK